MSIESSYADWRLYNDLVVDALRRMSPRELALRAPSTKGASSTSWPIWAIAAHAAGTRVFWLCHVLGVPGADTTPFGEADGVGWEDDLSRPRSAGELVTAWTTTWGIVERVLPTWTPGMLDEQIAVGEGDGARHFTRRSVLLRCITHEGYHVGEIALIQGSHGMTPIDLWPAGYHTVEAMAAREQQRRRG